MSTETDIEAIAAEALVLLGTGRQVTPFSARYETLTLPAAYHVTSALRKLREARGETVIGRKVGFANRTIWDQYGIHAPVWGFMYDTTVHELPTLAAGFPLAGMPQPLIEPEIVLSFGRDPEPGMDEAALLECIDCVAHGFEFVQSLFPGWKMAAADSVAGYGLHGAFLLGEKTAIANDRAYWLAALCACEIELFCNGAKAAHGHAENLLGGPLSSLKHLNDLLAADPHNPPLRAGEFVTTGTITPAMPVAAGETWSTRPIGITLPGIEVRLT